MIPGLVLLVSMASKGRYQKRYQKKKYVSVLQRDHLFLLHELIHIFFILRAYAMRYILSRGYTFTLCGIEWHVLFILYYHTFATCYTSWWLQPEKYESNWIISPGRGENKKYLNLKRPPSYMIGKGNFPTNPSMEKPQSFRAGTSSKGFSVTTFRVKLDWFSTMLPDWPEDSVGFFGKHKASVTRNFGVTGSP